MEIIVVKMMNVSGSTLWNILFMKENTKMSKKKELQILWGLVRKINNTIFGYRPRGKDVRKRKSRSKRSKAKK